MRGRLSDLFHRLGRVLRSGRRRLGSAGSLLHGVLLLVRRGRCRRSRFRRGSWRCGRDSSRGLLDGELDGLVHRRWCRRGRERAQPQPKAHVEQDAREERECDSSSRVPAGHAGTVRETPTLYFPGKRAVGSAVTERNAAAIRLSAAGFRHRRPGQLARRQTHAQEERRGQATFPLGRKVVVRAPGGAFTRLSPLGRDCRITLVSHQAAGEGGEAPHIRARTSSARSQWMPNPTET